LPLRRKRDTTFVQVLRHLACSQDDEQRSDRVLLERFVGRSLWNDVAEMSKRAGAAGVGGGGQAGPSVNGGPGGYTVDQFASLFRQAGV
jgi:hypothetical protein